MLPTLIQAPMAGVQDHRLAVAVSNHGGLGSLPFGMLAPQAMHQELAAYRALSQRPVNVNFFCHTMPAPDTARFDAWCAQLQPFAQTLGLAQPHAQSALRQPFDEHGMAVVQAFLPEVVSFHFGLPSEHFVQAIKALGIKIISSATTLQEALYLQTHGADAIIAQGVEAGGHRAIFLNQDLNTQLPTLTLLKQLVSRLSIPIIAAGGVGDARDVQTALAAGASAVQIGSAFLLSQEATTSAVHRAALLRAQQALHNAAYTLAPYAASDLPYTALTNLFSGRPARGLMNRFMREMGAMHADAPAFPYASAAIAALRTASEQQGLDDFTPLWCGQNLLAPKALPAAAIMDQLLTR